MFGCCINLSAWRWGRNPVVAIKKGNDERAFLNEDIWAAHDIYRLRKTCGIHIVVFSWHVILKGAAVSWLAVGVMLLTLRCIGLSQDILKGTRRVLRRSFLAFNSSRMITYRQSVSMCFSTAAMVPITLMCFSVRQRFLPFIFRSNWADGTSLGDGDH